MKRFFLFLFTFVMAFDSYAAGKGRVFNDIPVSQEIADEDMNAVAYSVQSDGLGVYLNGVNGDISGLMENGYNGIPYADRRLDLGSVRKLTITLSAANAVWFGDPGYIVEPTILGTVITSVWFRNNCSIYNTGFLPMSSGSAIHCPMVIGFGPGDGIPSPYRLMMGLNDRPETQKVQIRCNSADSDGCNDWFVNPVPVVNPDGSTSAGQTLARLEESVITKGKQTTWVNRGGFYLTFHIHVTRP